MSMTQEEARDETKETQLPAFSAPAIPRSLLLASTSRIDLEMPKGVNPWAIKSTLCGEVCA